MHSRECLDHPVGLLLAGVNDVAGRAERAGEEAHLWARASLARQPGQIGIREGSVQILAVGLEGLPFRSSAASAPAQGTRQDAAPSALALGKLQIAGHALISAPILLGSRMGPPPAIHAMPGMPGTKELAHPSRDIGTRSHVRRLSGLGLA
ncbi:hypothetical protein GCM10027187_63410 [Streptosporangium sandarakinum]